MKSLVNVCALAVAIVVGTAATGYGASILYMQQTANMDFDDQMGEFIESLGHEVEFFDTSGTIDIDQIEAAEEFDLVYIAESLGSGTTHDGVETFIKEVETPQLWAEAYAWDEAAMTADEQFIDFGNTQRANPDEDPSEDTIDGQTHLIIKDPNHPMAAGFTGEVQVYEEEYSLNWGLVETMGPGAEIIATVDEAGEFATQFVYQKGAELEDGTPAAGVRIGLFVAQPGVGPVVFENLTDNGLKMIEAAINFGLNPVIGEPPPPELQAGDADQDLDFDQLDLVKVQIAAKYLAGQGATWGDGDWNGAPGGKQGEPPVGDGQFNQLDIIAALGPAHYLTGPYAALAGGGAEGDGQTSLVYDAGTGELRVDPPAGTDLTSINITSAGSMFIGDKPAVLDGAFDNFAGDNIFKATFGGMFGAISFGNVLAANIPEETLLADLSAVGSLAGGGDLGNVDLVYIPEPAGLLMLAIGIVGGMLVRPRRSARR